MFVCVLETDVLSPSHLCLLNTGLSGKINAVDKSSKQHLMLYLLRGEANKSAESLSHFCLLSLSWWSAGSLPLVIRVLWKGQRLCVISDGIEDKDTGERLLLIHCLIGQWVHSQIFSVDFGAKVKKCYRPNF